MYPGRPSTRFPSLSVKGHFITIGLVADLDAQLFPDSQLVNEVLRALIRIADRQQIKAKRERRRNAV